MRRGAVLAAGGVLVAALVAGPAVLDSYFQHVLILVLYSAYLSTAWNILGGYAGQISIGHAAFLGVGAYTSTTLLAKAGVTPWAGMALGAVLAMALAYAVGWLTFRYRLRGHYFTLATIAIAEILRLVAIHVDYIGGAFGMMVPVTSNSVLYFVSTEKRLYYYTILAMLAALLAAVRVLERSKTGVYWLAIREDEQAAEAAGIDTARYKVRAMVVSSAFIALGGTFYAQYVTFIDPETVLGVLPSVEMLLPAIVGGMGTLVGPLLGASILVPLSEATKAWFASARGIHLLVYGVVLILFLRFLSTGVVGALERLVALAAPRDVPLEGLGVAAATDEHL